MPLENEAAVLYVSILSMRLVGLHRGPFFFCEVSATGPLRTGHLCASTVSLTAPLRPLGASRGSGWNGR